MMGIAYPEPARLFEITPTTSLWDAARELCEVARRDDVTCVAVFNGRGLVARADTTERELFEQFDAGTERLWQK